ncbi:MAG: dTDP-4-dehydrorhamnose 3,5-epimerase [Campylobacterales bacterium]
MKFIQTELREVFIIEPKVFGDSRGYFFESFNKKLFEESVGYEVDFCQDNESKSSYGVLRGLHYQLPPFAQAKLVRVVEGTVLDVAVDIRRDSPTFGKHVAVELSSENKRQLFIPRGFAHGFVTLSESAIFQYKVDNYYAPEYERGIAYNDSDIGINWKISDSKMRLSGKDKEHPMLKDSEVF